MNRLLLLLSTAAFCFSVIATFENDPNHPLAPRKCLRNMYMEPEKGACQKIPGGGNFISLNSSSSCEGRDIWRSKSTIYYHLCVANGTRVLTARCPPLYGFNGLNCSVLMARRPRVPRCLEPGTFSIVQDCRWYYNCTTGKLSRPAKVHRCPSGETFNEEKKQCGNVTRCPNHPTSVFNYLSIQKGYPQCIAPGRFTVAYNCTYFYICVEPITGNYTQLRLKCPMGEIHYGGKCVPGNATTCQPNNLPNRNTSLAPSGTKVNSGIINKTESINKDKKTGTTAEDVRYKALNGTPTTTQAEISPPITQPNTASPSETPTPTTTSGTSLLTSSNSTPTTQSDTTSTTPFATSTPTTQPSMTSTTSASSSPTTLPITTSTSSATSPTTTVPSSTSTSSATSPTTTEQTTISTTPPATLPQTTQPSTTSTTSASSSPTTTLPITPSTSSATSPTTTQPSTTSTTSASSPPTTLPITTSTSSATSPTTIPSSTSTSSFATSPITTVPSSTSTSSSATSPATTQPSTTSTKSASLSPTTLPITTSTSSATSLPTTLPSSASTSSATSPTTTEPSTTSTTPASSSPTTLPITTSTYSATSPPTTVPSSTSTSSETSPPTSEPSSTSTSSATSSPTTLSITTSTSSATSQPTTASSLTSTSSSSTSPEPSTTSPTSASSSPTTLPITTSTSSATSPPTALPVTTSTSSATSPPITVPSSTSTSSSATSPATTEPSTTSTTSASSSPTILPITTSTSSATSPPTTVPIMTSTPSTTSQSTIPSTTTPTTQPNTSSTTPSSTSLPTQPSTISLSGSSGTNPTTRSNPPSPFGYTSLPDTYFDSNLSTTIHLTDSSLSKVSDSSLQANFGDDQLTTTDTSYDYVEEQGITLSPLDALELFEFNESHYGLSAADVSENETTSENMMTVIENNSQENSSQVTKVDVNDMISLNGNSTEDNSTTSTDSNKMEDAEFASICHYNESQLSVVGFEGPEKFIVHLETETFDRAVNICRSGNGYLYQLESFHHLEYCLTTHYHQHSFWIDISDAPEQTDCYAVSFNPEYQGYDVDWDEPPVCNSTNSFLCVH